MATRPASPLTFQGFASPTYTQVPDELFDVLLPQLADNELRVLLYIIRRTFGFKREADSISLSQMVHGITTREGTVLDAGTGLSKSTVARGLKSLRDKGIIDATRNSSAERGDQPTTYRLRFKTDTAPGTDPGKPVSHQQDSPRVAPARQAVWQRRDTQETDPQKTAFEYSRGDDSGKDQHAGEWDRLDHTVSKPDHSGAALANNPLGSLLQHRIRRDVGKDDRQAIGVAITRIAAELGDRADTAVTISRALNLYQASGIGVAGFIDLLYQARGEVKDRHAYPGKAPLPRNRMAYFFAVVEDRLGLRQREETGEFR